MDDNDEDKTRIRVMRIMRNTRMMLLMLMMMMMMMIMLIIMMRVRITRMRMMMTRDWPAALAEVCVAARGADLSDSLHLPPAGRTRQARGGCLHLARPFQPLHIAHKKDI